MPAASRSRHTPRYALAIVLVGLAGAAFAIAFRTALHAVFARLFARADVLAAFRSIPPLYRLALPAVGGFVAGAIGVIAARTAGGHGVADVLEAVSLGRGRVSPTTSFWKALGSFVAMVSGGSIGREGPLIQFGAGAGGEIGRRFGVSPQRARALVAAGTAAGFAAAYNTPLAAVLFVVEIVTGVVALPVLLPVVVATAVATSVTRLAIGGGPVYGLRTFAVSSSYELLAYAVLGVLAGLVGPAFMAMLGAGERLFARVKAPRPVKGALGGLVVGALAVGLPEVTGNGYEAIQLMLEGRFLAPMLCLLLVTKAVATVASVSSGSPGGVFTPSMFLGASLGGIVGIAVSAVGQRGGGVVAGGYALVGMAAVIAATTHAPLMAAVLVFELSGDYAVVLPLMLATTIATLLARRLRRDSIYTEELRRRGIPWEGTVTERLARTVRARDIMELDPLVVRADASLDDALAVLERGHGRAVWVECEGEVRALDLRAAMRASSARAREGPKHGDALSVGPIAQPTMSASPEDSLVVLSEKLWGVDWPELPVVDPAAPSKVIAVVTARAVLGAFDRELLQRDILNTRVVWRDVAGEAADYLELPRGNRIEVIAPPARWVGRALDCAALRRDARVTVVGVRSGGPESEGDAAWVEPNESRAVHADDRWMVIGTPEAIEALRRGNAPPTAPA